MVDLRSHSSDANGSDSSESDVEGVEVERWVGYQTSFRVAYHLIS